MLKLRALFQLANFLCPYMAGRAQELCGASVIRIPVPCMRAPPSRPALPEALPPGTITIAIKISTYKFGGRGEGTKNTQSIVMCNPQKEWDISMWTVGERHHDTLWSEKNWLYLSYGGPLVKTTLLQPPGHYPCFFLWQEMFLSTTHFSKQNIRVHPEQPQPTGELRTFCLYSLYHVQFYKGIF